LNIKHHKLVTFKTILKKCKNKSLSQPLNYKLKKIISTRGILKSMSLLKQEKSYKMKLMTLNVKRNNLFKKYPNFNLCSILKNKWNKNIFHFYNKKKPKIKNLKLSSITLWNKKKELLSQNWKNHNISSTYRVTLYKWKEKGISLKSKTKKIKRSLINLKSNWKKSIKTSRKLTLNLVIKKPLLIKFHKN